VSESTKTVVGHVELKSLPIVVSREPEVGIAWEAAVEELGLAALGRTPGEAADNLGETLRKRGLVDVVNVSRKLVNDLVRRSDD
jgi:hypothetical protein